MRERLAQPDRLNEQVAHTETSGTNTAAALSQRFKFRIKIGTHERRRDERPVFDSKRLDVGDPDQCRRQSIKIHVNVDAYLGSMARAWSDNDGVDRGAVGIFELIGRVEVIINCSKK